MLISEDVDVRVSAVFALGKSENPNSFNRLLNSLSDKHFAVQREVVMALKQRKELKAVSHLINCLSNENPSIREEAAFAIEEMELKVLL